MRHFGYIMIGALLAVLSACEVEDKGHYDYMPMNEITIEGIEPSYDLLMQDEDVIIEPKLKASVPVDESNYSYSWFLCSGVDHQHTQLSTEKNFRVPSLNPGTYTLYFEVTDNSTGLKWLEDTILYVTTDYTAGFLLLGDEPDSDLLRMDMIMVRVNDTIVGERVFVNDGGFRNAESLLFSGAGGRMMGLDMDGSKDLYVLTKDQDFKITSGTYFKVVDDFNSLGILETEVNHATPMRVKDVFPRPSLSGSSAGYRARTKRGYITEDMIVMNSVIQTEYFSTPINKYDAASTRLFHPYPLAFGQGSCSYSQFYPIFFDMDAQCFVTPYGASDYVSPTSWAGVTHCRKLSDKAGDIFQWDLASQGRTLLYGENGYALSTSGTSNSYALVTDQEGNYYIYVFATTKSATWYVMLLTNHTKRYCELVDQGMAQNFAQASHYAFLSQKYVVLYSVGSMLYAYDYTREHFASMDLGAEITCLKTEYNSKGSLSDIIVATFDQSSGTGVVRKLTIGGGNNSLTIGEKPREIWPVTMRVKDILWKNVGDNDFELEFLENEE